jgi:hypothetical protein
MVFDEPQLPHHAKQENTKSHKRQEDHQLNMEMAKD